MFQGPILLTPESRLTSFDSGKLAIDDWLKRFALQAHRSNSTRVFVFHDDEETVVGFYALSAGSIACDEAPARVRRGQGRYPVPVALITRLAVDRRHQGRGLGKRLLSNAILRAFEASKELGIRAIQAHAKDEEARAFYESFGFEPSPVHDLWMFLLIKDVAASLK